MASKKNLADRVGRRRCGRLRDDVGRYALNWGGWLDAVDTDLLQAFHNFGAKRPEWVQFWVVFCVVFGPNGFRVVALVLFVVALVRRKLATALFLVVSVGLMGLVTEGAKYLAGRPRPATALAYGSSTSFPSGHALGVMVGVLALLTVLWPQISRRLRLVLACIGGGVLIVVVGVGGRWCSTFTTRPTCWPAGRSATSTSCCVCDWCRRARSAQRPKHRQHSILRGERRLVVVVADLTVAGQRCRAVDGLEGEFRGGLDLVVERAAFQAAEATAVRMRSRLSRLPVSKKMRTSMRPSSMRVRRAGAKPDGR